MRPRKPHRPSPARPTVAPAFKKLSPPRDTLAPRAHLSLSFPPYPARRAFPDPRAQRSSRRAQERLALPDRREDLLHRHHRGAHPSQVPETAGRPNLDRDPRHGPTHRGGPRGHRRTPHGDRDRRRALSGQRRLPLRGNVRANLPHRRLQARGLVRRRGRREERKHSRVPHEGAAGPAAAGQHLLQPRAPFSEPSRRAGRRRVADRGQVSRQGGRPRVGFAGQGIAHRRRRGRDGPTGSMHQGTLRRGEGGARRVAPGGRDGTGGRNGRRRRDSIPRPRVRRRRARPRIEHDVLGGSPRRDHGVRRLSQGSRVGVPEAASDPRHAHRPRGEQRTEGVGDTADGVGGDRRRGVALDAGGRGRGRRGFG